MTFQTTHSRCRFVLFTIALVLTACGGSTPSGPPSNGSESVPSPPPPAPPQPPSSSPVLGIDVSHHSGEVDWQKIKGVGYGFVYVKATEGIDALDSQFADNWRGTAAVGLPRGAFHFYVTEDDPNAQADFFINTVPAEDLGDLVPVVDVEILGHGTPDDWVSNLKTFVDRIEDHFGIKPMIYTGPKFWNNQVWNKPGGTEFQDHLLWIAQWDVDEPTIPNGWSQWALWQDKADQTVDGAEKEVDLNRLAEGLDLEAIQRKKSPE